jgi:hypothetical protein
MCASCLEVKGFDCIYQRSPSSSVKAADQQSMTDNWLLVLRKNHDDTSQDWMSKNIHKWVAA